MDEHTQKLMAMCRAMVCAGEGRLTLVHNEEDDTPDRAADAAHFLKHYGARLGRDIELYGFMGKAAGWPWTLATVLEELLLPIKGGLPEAYEAGSERLKELGKEVYDAETYAQFLELF